MHGCFIHHAPYRGFQGQYKQIANKQYEWTKRFIKSQLAGAEQLAIFKVQPKIEPWANENKSREYQDKRLERRNTKLQIQHPNYSVTRGNTKLQIQHPNYSVTSGNTKLQIQHPNHSVFWRVRGSTWITNKELEKFTLKHRLTPLPPHSLLFITGHFPTLRESNVWHWLSTHICNKMRWSSCRHWLVKTRKTRFNLLG